VLRLIVRKILVLTAMLAGTLLPVLPAAAQGYPPPAPVYERAPYAPGPGYVWLGGHYRWDGYRYVWVPGHYVRPPYGYSSWVPGHWVNRPNGAWVWIPGHWR